MRSGILEALERRCGHAPSPAAYATLSAWRDWWGGKCETFHTFIEAGGRPPRKRDMYKMGMAKKICEDWATILINDRTNIRTDDAQINACLFGDRHGVGGVLTGGDFWGQMNRLVEMTFAMGTGAVTVHFPDASYDAGKQIIRAGGMEMNYVAADHIFPLSMENGAVVSCAFAGQGEILRSGKRLPVVFLEIHQKEYAGDGRVRWRIDNVMLDEEGAEVPVPDEVAPYFYAPMPLFALLRPNIVNPDPATAVCGMGASVFASAIDNLKGVDLAYNNFCRDLYLGGKKVFINQSLTEEDAYGNRIAPDDVAQQLFVCLGDGDLSSQAMIVEHNPALRCEENCTAVQAQLDYLSLKVGFGTRHYRFSTGQTVTATQFAGERQELLQHAMKHYVHVEAFLRSLVGIAYWYATALAGYPLPPLCEVTVSFDDSFFIDPAAERKRDLEEVRYGLMAPWEYRVRYYGEAPEVAQAAVRAIRTEADEQIFESDAAEAVTV